MAPFALPALPSLPSVKSFINVSPPLVYPSPDEKNRLRSRTASVSSTVSHQLDSTNEYGSPRRHGRSSHRLPFDTDDHTPTRRPRPTLHHSASLLASPKHDELDERRWEPISHRLVNDSDLTPHASPSRTRSANHRRSHSAVAQRHSLLHLNQSYTSSAPMGRLHEISRNPLASTSAISLPTLLEGADMIPEERSDTSTNGSSLGLFLASPEEQSASSRSICSPRFSLSSLASSTTSSPIIHARPRKGSRSTTDGQGSPISPVSLPLSMPPPLIPLKSAARPRSDHKRSFSSVPPPQTMRPPPLPIMSGPLAVDYPIGFDAKSRRGSDSQAGIKPRQPFAHRHSSVSSTSSISDVAVLATWSFPSSPQDEHSSLAHVGQENTPPISQPSDRLRERLQSLSTLDTAMRNGKTPNGSPKLWSSILPGQAESRTDLVSPRTPKPNLVRASTSIRPMPSRTFPAHLTHRHSHSSPSDIVPNLPIGPSISGSYHPTCGSGLNPTSSTIPQSNLNPLMPPPPIHPPPRHLRRPTTTRLRQPNPLR
jgi:hypothetical protein